MANKFENKKKFQHTIWISLNGLVRVYKIRTVVVCVVYIVAIVTV